MVVDGADVHKLMDRSWRLTRWASMLGELTVEPTAPGCWHALRCAAAESPHRPVC